MAIDIILLDPRPDPKIRKAMLDRLGEGPTLGVEVTVDELAAACAANLDGQHGPDASGEAAVWIAATISGMDANWADNWAAQDPDGMGGKVAAAVQAGRYATIRPDRDSLGAIAVLSRPWSVLTKEQMGRIRQIAEADSSAPRPGGPADPGTGAPDAFAALGFLAEDRAVPVEERVARHWQWIDTGAFAGSAVYLERAAAARAEVAELEKLVRVVEIGGIRIAVISTTSRMGVVAAYRHADIVVAESPTFRWAQGHTTRKITVCAQPGAPVALDMVARELNAGEAEAWTPEPDQLPTPPRDGSVAETARFVVQSMRVGPPTWGGQKWIIGSPQGVDPKASLDDVVRVVKSFVLRTEPGECLLFKFHSGCQDPHPCEADDCPCGQYCDLDGTGLAVAEPLRCACGHGIEEHHGF